MLEIVVNLLNITMVIQSAFHFKDFFKRIVSNKKKYKNFCEKKHYSD